jgi:hypothetical protein
MYFAFFSCEVKCGGAALEIADRQNAHSMALAVRGVAELFLAINRANEVNRKILAFSISHENSCVRIYGHYPVIDGCDIKYCRHTIHAFDFTVLGGKEKWMAYRFTKNVYDMWMPQHPENIRSALDMLPSDWNPDGPQLLEAAGFSQSVGDVMWPSAGCAPVLDEEGSPSWPPLPAVLSAYRRDLWQRMRRQRSCGIDAWRSG